MVCPAIRTLTLDFLEVHGFPDVIIDVLSIMIGDSNSDYREIRKRKNTQRLNWP
ncbi:13423_t:CDS:2 [Cetraspora pellucida]|uniref:13423_t:CDS:1 n=1 Tax=Cetraspora pellucida TaxID=1433469 RepID=A0A9N9D6S5_9GLOM|nr:13423_t:CDS:2 [Cetraspora pellucida]